MNVNERNRPSTVAAVDLGSNSFHMVVARLVQGEVHVIDRLNERVSLASGLDDRKNIGSDARRRALSCLARFGQRLRFMPHGSVRAVATNTLRQARNAPALLSKARAALGHPIEIISGREEARLIYVGVSSDLPQRSGRRLVVDIGGGSTECIVGEGSAPLLMDSLYMGCVAWSRRFFPRGRLSAKAFREAILAARLELQPVELRYRTLGWNACVGSSGTILAVETIVRQAGWSRDGISRRGLAKLVKLLIDSGNIRGLALAGLSQERAPVFAGGVAILQAVFESFALEQMHASSAALREGVLYDLLGRIRHEDARDQTIRRMSERYHADIEQAARVERTALDFLAQVAPAWKLQSESCRQELSWAARLHEIGLSVSHAGHHRHGAYLIANSDMPGFSRSDQATVASLVRWHRRRIETEEFVAMAPEADFERLARLVVLLRLSVHLNRGREPRALPAVRLLPHDDSLSVRFPRGWLKAHPLTGAELAEEVRLLAEAGFTLKVT